MKRGDTVAAMLPNVPAMVELHFGPAMFGAVLNTLNTRLDAEAIAFMLDHGEAKVLFTDREFSPTIAKALKLAKARPTSAGSAAACPSRISNPDQRLENGEQRQSHR